MVDLPEPVCPTMATVWPGSTSKVISSSVVISASMSQPSSGGCVAERDVLESHGAFDGGDVSGGVLVEIGAGVDQFQQPPRAGQPGGDA